MASTYSDLKIELIGTGEQTGTWGSATNNNLSIAVSEAITGSADVTFSSADVTVTLTDTSNAQTARNLRLNLTGTSGGARNLILGSGCQIEKLYLINNGLADAVTVKNTSGTGIAVPAGASMFVYNNGTNVVEALKAIPVAAGGTGLATLTSNNVLIGNGTSNVGFVAPGSNGNVLTSNGSTWTSTAPAAGTTFSAGTTGFTPNTATSGAVTLSGTLAVANGGTGQTTYTNGELLIGNTTGNTLTKATLTQGTGISITNGTGSITIAATGGGTVTSVATGNGLSGGTITTSGTLAVACPTYGSVGSYVGATIFQEQNQTISAGSDFAAGSNPRQMGAGGAQSVGGNTGIYQAFGLSGTWRWFGGSVTYGGEGLSYYASLACRVS